MEIISAEFGSKQSHEIWPRYYEFYLRGGLEVKPTFLEFHTDTAEDTPAEASSGRHSVLSACSLAPSGISVSP